uniref:Uncharacterized protein n=1 Tax=Tetradesmus obliquus TaxID=3088 RepID=A0A383W444_TETOB|eukprot:jgi/Sobl393_1/1525/SZX72251.1
MALAGTRIGAPGARSTSNSAMAGVHGLRSCTLHTPCSPASSSSCSSSSSSSHIGQLGQRSSLRLRQRPVAYAASSDMPGSSSNGGRPGGGSSGGAGRSRKTGKARKPGLFEIKVVTPPPRSLGIYALPPMTHNGEEVGDTTWRLCQQQQQRQQQQRHSCELPVQCGCRLPAAIGALRGGSLTVWCLIEIEGQGYVVTRLELTFKLVKGRYVRDHSRLEVQPTGRYFLNMMLDNLIHGTYVGPADCGQQD